MLYLLRKFCPTMNLSGKKTYTIVVAMLLFAAYGLSIGKFSDVQAIQLALQALGLAGLRNAIPSHAEGTGEEA